MFHRRFTDGTRLDVPLEDAFAGPFRTPCWIIGGGPSLTHLDCQVIQQSPAVKFAVNLAGTGLLRPNLWTSYDPSARFHRSTFLDASILKFVHPRRAMDLVPETTHKVCDCPNLFFFDADARRGFANFLATEHKSVIDWNDSLMQAIDIAYRLGFRTFYLVGCDMQVRPSHAMLDAGRSAGVEFTPGETLQSYCDRCREAGASFDESGDVDQYHFDEQKPLPAAIQTDAHYFRVVQYLRLARRAISLAGVELISVTPQSRLNDHFRYQSVAEADASICRDVGDPDGEQTRGRYSTTTTRSPDNVRPMRDVRPHHWPHTDKERPPTRADHPGRNGHAVNRLQAAIADLPEVPVHLDEQG